MAATAVGEEEQGKRAEKGEAAAWRELEGGGCGSSYSDAG
jgi:hypothetical protein